MPAPSGELRAVTFDCWSTLIVETRPQEAFEQRLLAFHRLLVDAGQDPPPSLVELALTRAWRRHADAWEAGQSTGAREVSGWALGTFEITDPVRIQALTDILSRPRTTDGVIALEGARETLQALTARRLGVGLICDTGLVSGVATRELLDRAGLLSSLQVLIFSDEAGVPKPHAKVFEAALSGLGVRAGDAVHVGDLRRTDIAGARKAGMGSVRIRAVHDDLSQHPEADHVVDSHAALLALLSR